jgi:DNA polymerase III subunit epsilon
MLILGADIETTGLLNPDGTPGDHRIIEFYGGLWDLDSRKRVNQYFARINPQRSIAPAAQAVHKISLAELEHCDIWDNAGPIVRDFLERADLIVGHNWDGFDKPFIDGELNRIGLPAVTKPTFDTMLQGRWSTAMGTVPNLGALCWACDIPYDASSAHKADYDVGVMMQSFFRGVDWGWFKLEAPASAIAA